ncbi:MAG TPA: methyltransferase domain-containing protein [Myxococcales bacterium]|jgi:SAM-dependent methyltransferase
MDFPALLEHLSRLPDSPYRYPDAAAAIEAKLPPTKREAERRLWAEALDRSFGQAHPVPGTALDAGCGDGEYLPDLAARFEHAFGLDADARRIAAAHQRCPAVRCFPLEVSSEALPELDGQLCFAQCLQVLGHVSCVGSEKVMSRLAGWLAPGAHLLLAVPYTNEPFDDFRVSELGVAESHRVEREAYDAAADAPRAGTLPVRHFAMPSVQALLAAARLAPEWSSPYGWLSYQHADLMILARKK